MTFDTVSLIINPAFRFPSNIKYQISDFQITQNIKYCEKRQIGCVTNKNVITPRNVANVNRCDTSNRIVSII